MDHLVSMLPINAGHILLPIARLELERILQGKAAGHEPLPQWAHQPGASFITLMQDGELRGCIGTLLPYQPLIQDVKTNTVNAALRDPRFPALDKTELEDTFIELSVLSPIEAMQVKDEEDALLQLRPGVDGLVFEWRGRRSTFLPQVWENVSDRAEFLCLLKRKAGLPVDFWADDVHLSRYSVFKWKEQDIASEAKHIKDDKHDE